MKNGPGGLPVTPIIITIINNTLHDVWTGFVNIAFNVFQTPLPIHYLVCVTIFFMGSPEVFSTQLSFAQWNRCLREPAMILECACTCTPWCML